MHWLDAGDTLVRHLVKHQLDVLGDVKPGEESGDVGVRRLPGKTSGPDYRVIIHVVRLVTKTKSKWRLKRRKTGEHSAELNVTLTVRLNLQALHLRKMQMEPH